MDRSYYEFSEEAKRRFNDRLRWILVAIMLSRKTEPELLALQVDDQQVRMTLEGFHSKAAECYKALAEEQPLAREKVRIIQTQIEQALEREELVQLYVIDELVRASVKLVWDAINFHECETDDRPLFELLLDISRVSESKRVLLDLAELNQAQHVLEVAINKYIEKGEFDDYYIHKLVGPLLNDVYSMSEFKRMVDVVLKFVTPGASEEPPELEA